MVLRHFGKIENGKKVYHNLPLYTKTIQSLEGKEFEEVIKEKRKRVTNDQHAYYRGGVIPTAMEFEMFGGWTADEIHEHFAGLFLCYTTTEKKLVNEETILKYVTKTQSTSSLSTKGMAEFVDHVIHWLAQHGIVVLTPDEYYSTKYSNL